MRKSLPSTHFRLCVSHDSWVHEKHPCGDANHIDHDRHGIVARSVGLLPPNHYLSVAILYLFQHRPNWNKDAAVGKTVVSSKMIDPND